MKHFIVGPVEAYPQTMEIYKKEHPYFRTNEYGEFVKSCLKRLSLLLGNEIENSLIYLTASGTASMEAVVENCLNKDDKSLVINGGTFGKRFCQLLEHHQKNYNAINLNWNECLTDEHLENYNNKGYTTLFVNLHETSTGQLYDIKMLSDFCKQNNMMLIVDAISTFLADEYDMEKYGIDATIISSQKGLCLSPGLSFISFSQRMLDKIKSNNDIKTVYFDFKDYLTNIERGQTPYTPAVLIMYELDAMLNLIQENNGKERWLNLIQEKCEYFREKIRETGLKIPTGYRLSNMLTPVLSEDIDANILVKHLRDNYGLCVNPCGGELGKKLFRVSHIGNTNLTDIDNLIEKLKLSIEEISENQLQEVRL